MSVPPKTFILRQVKQIRALSGPAQNQIVGTLERVGPSTATELSVQLGIPAESLYYHLRRLKEVGVLVEAGRRSPGARSPSPEAGSTPM